MGETSHQEVMDFGAPQESPTLDNINVKPGQQQKDRRNKMHRTTKGTEKPESPDASGALSNGVKDLNTNPLTNTLEGPASVTHLTLAQTQPGSNNHELKNQLDLNDLRLTQDFDGLAPAKKILTMVPIRKPSPQQFIRVHEDPDWCFSPVAILEVKDDRENYLVTPSIYEDLATEVTCKALYAVINRTGDISLWPVRLPDSGGRQDNWNRSALIAVEEAKRHWTRVVSNIAQGIYEVQVAAANIPDPVWPTGYTFLQIVEIAFRDRIISSLDHPVLRRLRGEL